MQLNKDNLTNIAKGAQTPQYDRGAVKCGIVHMSVGGFHRSHQAVYIDDLLATGVTDWGICGIGLLPNDKDNIQALSDQDGLYTVLERTAAGDTARVIGSMLEVMHAPSNPEAVMAKLMDEDIRILSLTITEKGYAYNTQGKLDQTNDMIKHDLTLPAAPKTAYGYIVGALAARRKAGMKPFTVMSCDNLPGNGHLTQNLVIEFATLVDGELGAWIKDNVTFPNAMVDRITPVTTDMIIDIVKTKFDIDDKWPVVCEDFRQWVLEDSFCNGRPALDSVGVQIVEDVEPYEKMKVRLLNGAHSALAYLSYLMGYSEVDKAMADPIISTFVRKYMDFDVTPCVPDVPGMDLNAYKDKLIERFANPAISDQVQRLAEDGSAKIPNSILPCVRYQLENGGSVKFIALALAGWFKYLKGVDEKLEPIAIKDPRADLLKSSMTADSRDPTHILAIEDIFGKDLPVNPVFITEITNALESLHTKGARATVETYIA